MKSEAEAFVREDPGKARRRLNKINYPYNEVWYDTVPQSMQYTEHELEHELGANPDLYRRYKDNRNRNPEL